MAHRVHRAEAVDDAVRLLASFGPAGSLLAGGTWIMRAAARGETLRREYVALPAAPELRTVARADGGMRIGALVTHREIAAIEHGTGPLGALAEAARRSAFPAVRNVATLGGNIAAPFPEADLVPPLLAGDARLELASRRGSASRSTSPRTSPTPRADGRGDRRRARSRRRPVAAPASSA